MVLQFAQGLDDTNALNSASYGVAQIMGFNSGAIGFTTVQAMFLAFSASIKAQLQGFFDFIKKSPKCLTGLRTADLLSFAQCYNGMSNEAQWYAGNMTASAAAYVKVMPNTVCKDSTGALGVCQSSTAACTGGTVATSSTGCTGSLVCCVIPVDVVAGVWAGTTYGTCTPKGSSAGGACYDKSRCVGENFPGRYPSSAPAGISCCVRDTCGTAPTATVAGTASAAAAATGGASAGSAVTPTGGAAAGGGGGTTPTAAANPVPPVGGAASSTGGNQGTPFLMELFSRRTHRRAATTISKIEWESEDNGNNNDDDENDDDDQNNDDNNDDEDVANFEEERDGSSTGGANPTPAATVSGGQNNANANGGTPTGPGAPATSSSTTGGATGPANSASSSSSSDVAGPDPTAPIADSQGDDVPLEDINDPESDYNDPEELVEPLVTVAGAPPSDVFTLGTLTDDTTQQTLVAGLTDAELVPFDESLDAGSADNGSNPPTAVASNGVTGGTPTGPAAVAANGGATGTGPASTVASNGGTASAKQAFRVKKHHKKHHKHSKKHHKNVNPL